MNKFPLEYLDSKKTIDCKQAICLFHGYGASMEDLYGLCDYLDPSGEFDWYFPNGHLASQFGGRAWFPIDMMALQTAMAQGEHRSFAKLYTDEFQTAVNLGQDFVNELTQIYDKVIIGGFSQGAMISSHIALNVSEKLNGLILYSSNLLGQEQLINALEESAKFPFFQSHGKQDQVLSYHYAKSLFELYKLGGHEGEFVSFDGGHEIPLEVLEKTKNYIRTL